MTNLNGFVAIAVSLCLAALILQFCDRSQFVFSKPLLNSSGTAVNNLAQEFVEKVPTISPVSNETTMFVLGIYNEAVKFWDSTYTFGHWGITAPMYKYEKINLLMSAMAKLQSRGVEIKNICEVGVMAGSSSVVMLLQAPTAKWWGFDYVVDAQVRITGAGGFLSRAFPEKANFISGDSSVTVPKFKQDHPEILCDVVLIDGSKAYAIRKADVHNFRAISHPNTVVLMDEICSSAFVKGDGNDNDCNGFSYYEASRVYREAVKEGILEVTDCVMTAVDSDGFCAGRFKYEK